MCRAIAWCVATADAQEPNGFMPPGAKMMTTKQFYLEHNGTPEEGN